MCGQYFVKILIIILQVHKSLFCFSFASKCSLDRLIVDELGQSLLSSCSLCGIPALRCSRGCSSALFTTQNSDEVNDHRPREELEPTYHSVEA